MTMHSLDKWTAIPGRSAHDKRLITHTRPRPGTFGRLVRDYRMDLDISQAALAERMGVNHSYISRIESNDRTPDKISTVRRLAEALELGTAQTVALFRAAAGMEAGT